LPTRVSVKSALAPTEGTRQPKHDESIASTASKLSLVNLQEKQRHPRRKKKVIFSWAVLLLLIGIWFVYQQTHRRNPKELVIYGNIDIRQVNLGFRVGGRIQEMRVCRFAGSDRGGT
jgi:hypothetical protein